MSANGIKGEKLYYLSNVVRLEYLSSGVSDEEVFCVRAFFIWKHPHQYFNFSKRSEIRLCRLNELVYRITLQCFWRCLRNGNKYISQVIRGSLNEGIKRLTEWNPIGRRKRGQQEDRKIFWRKELTFWQEVWEKWKVKQFEWRKEVNMIIKPLPDMNET